MNFIFGSQLTCPYLHATCALLKDFEMFDNFDHIFILLLSLFRPLRVNMTRLGQKMNFKYSYLANRTQLSKKEWVWQLLWTPCRRLKEGKKDVRFNESLGERVH